MDIKNCIFGIKNKWFRNGAMEQYHQALKQQNMSLDELKQLNWEKRKKIVEHAYVHIPFYRRYYDEKKFNPSMLKTESDWGKVPILEKKMVQQFKDDMKDPKLKAKYFGEATTGGSTGIPLKVYTDRRFYDEILGWRAFTWWDISPAANVGIVHRNVPMSFLGKMKNRALWWPTKRIYLNASSYDETDIKRFLAGILKKKIVWLVGYVGAIERIADYILKNAIEICSVKLIWATSSPLYKHVRLKLEKAFNCKIMNQYGSNEIANIAIQCPKCEHLHINYDYIHVDIIDEKEDFLIDKEGDILVSSLYNYASPLIKYRLGDRGSCLSIEPKCHPFPLMGEIKGRITDSIYTPDGICVDAIFLTSIFDDYSDFFDQFQIFQGKDYSTKIFVKVFSETENTLNILSKIKKILEEKVQYKIPISIEIVDHIDDDKGKIRYIISEIALSKK